VLDDAFTDGEGEIEAAEGGVPLLKPGDDAQGVQVVIEAEAMRLKGLIEGLFAGVAEGRMADVMGQGEGFGELGVEAEGRGEGAGDLGDFKSVGGERRASEGCARRRGRTGCGRDEAARDRREERGGRCLRRRRGCLQADGQARGGTKSLRLRTLGIGKRWQARRSWS
jgi:hypothetical protein